MQHNGCIYFLFATKMGRKWSLGKEKLAEADKVNPEAE